MYFIPRTISNQSTTTFRQVIYLHACEEPTSEPILICEHEVHMHTMDIRFSFLKSLPFLLPLACLTLLVIYVLIRPNNEDIFKRPRDSKWLKGTMTTSFNLHQLINALARQIRIKL